MGMHQSVAQALMQAAFNQDIEGVAGPAMSYGFPSGAFVEIRFDTFGQQTADQFAGSGSDGRKPQLFGIGRIL